MRLRHNPENIHACYCSCHGGKPGLRDDPACENCGVFVCPTCTQVVPPRLLNVVNR